MQKTLYTIIGENQKLLKKYIFSHLSISCYILDVSIKLNKNLFVITLELIGILTILLCISSDMETNSFTWSKMYKPISNLKLKYLILSLLREKFARGAYSLCFYTLLWLRYLPVQLITIKALKEYK